MVVEAIMHLIVAPGYIPEGTITFNGWDAESRTVFITGEADPGGVSITIRY